MLEISYAPPGVHGPETTAVFLWFAPPDLGHMLVGGSTRDLDGTWPAYIVIDGDESAVLSQQHYLGRYEDVTSVALALLCSERLLV